jgi:ElaA protein
VLTNPAARGTGVGRVLMQQAIEQCKALFGDLPIKIGAQYYLLQFYSSLGFVQTSAIYLEDNIEHIEMIRNIQN